MTQTTMMDGRSMHGGRSRHGWVVRVVVLVVGVLAGAVTRAPGLEFSPEDSLTFGLPNLLPSTSYRPHVATDGAGTWIAVWSFGDEDAEIRMARSVDNGRTWGTAKNLMSYFDGDKGEDVEPRIVHYGGSTWIVVWAAEHAQIGGVSLGKDFDVLSAASRDGGLTWLGPTVVFNEPVLTTAREDRSPDILCAASGDCVVAWSSTALGGRADIWTSRSSTGTSWRNAVSVSDDGNEIDVSDVKPRLALRSDADGAPLWLLVWEEGTLGSLRTSTDIGIARSESDGATWTNRTRLSSLSADDRDPAIACDAADCLVVWTREKALDSDLWVRRSSDGSFWSSAKVLKPNDDVDSGDDESATIATDARGNWLVAWESTDDLAGSLETGGQANILVSRSVDGGKTWAYPEAANTDAGTADRDEEVPSLATDGAENATWVAVWRNRNRPSTGSVGVSATYTLIEDLNFGQDILAELARETGRVLGTLYDNIDWQNTVLPAGSFAIRMPGLKKVLAGEQGAFQVAWKFKDGSPTLIKSYVTSARPDKSPVGIYHNRRRVGDTIAPNGAPEVDLTAIPKSKLHYNEMVTDDALWIDGFKLQALEPGSGENPTTGLVLLEYQNNAGQATGFEIVDVREFRYDQQSDAFIGSRLLPYDRARSGSFATIRNGLDQGYVYRHQVAGSPQFGITWAIKKNTTYANVEVIWQHPSIAGVVWPFEIHQYRADWPASEPGKYQLFVRGAGDEPGPSVVIPAALTPNLVYSEHLDPQHESRLTNGRLATDGPGWTLLRYGTGTPAGKIWVGFEVVRSVAHDDLGILQLTHGSSYDLDPVPAVIGVEIGDRYHAGPEPGYIYEPEGMRYAPEVYASTGQIFAVNEDPSGVLEVWWSNLSRTSDPEGAQYPSWPSEDALRVQWPSKVVRYAAQWSVSPKEIVIAKQEGTGEMDPAQYGMAHPDGSSETGWSVYGVLGDKDDPDEPGFNPNDEHAVFESLGNETRAFALRDDLGSSSTSQPYVLIQYRVAETDPWQFEVYRVVRESSPYVLGDWAGIFRPEDPYEGEAGVLIQAPFPLSTFDPSSCNATVAVSGPAFEDRNRDHWAMAAGASGRDATITMRYFYPVQAGFYFPGRPVEPGTCVPWLDDQSGIPADVEYRISWPEVVPELRLSATLIDPMEGLDAITGHCAATVIYQQSQALGGGPSVHLLDVARMRSVDLKSLPADIETEEQSGKTVLPQLSLALRERIRFDAINEKLEFAGRIVRLTLGPPFALLNVLSEADYTELKSLSTDQRWRTAVDALWQSARIPYEVEDSTCNTSPEGVVSCPGPMPPFDKTGLVLSAGLAKGVGYVTLVTGNDKDKCTGSNGEEGVKLAVIKVVKELDRGAISVFEPSCPFDETLTLRHRGDFAGKVDDYEFQWCYQPASDSTMPALPPDGGCGSWRAFGATERGANEATIRGPGLTTLSDNWFVVRYRYVGQESHPLPNQWSEWADAQLAEGWIKRVVGNINPFDQRASGGGIAGAENSFFSFADQEVNTVVSMISQAGPRWEGDVPLNCQGVNDFGLLEIYETVLGRGRKLSIDGLPPVDYPPANQALLLAASRIADLYLLLGNEAYADAADPTIAFGTDDGIYGAEATSIHAFQNTTASLLEEELALLRGRDDSLAPGVRLPPLYNRLIWNFTKALDGGEVAYALNYNISDDLGNVDGTIDERDAKALYPQGHGDAWGHYLMALKTYYMLLRHPTYTWVPRAEGILVGGSPVSVDYLDERKFATVAAAKARAGSEIVNLTYREAYTEDPAGQWQGYRDSDPARAWGLAEWAARVGQGAYFDWVTGNAILPAVDAANTGIEKIDRTTVLELREVASRFGEIQNQLDTANQGLNPLGIANNVIPFDISPTEVASGKTHFEQIYERAIGMVNNAVVVFNHANNSTQLLRRQADTQNDFQRAVEDGERDFNNRLIEIFGYPYPEDIGPGRTYPSGYTGPDLWHHQKVDVEQLLGVDPGTIRELPVKIRSLEVNADGSLVNSEKNVTFTISTSADRYGEVRPANATGERRAPGEIQLARSELLLARVRFEQSIREYDTLLAEIDSQAAALEAQEALNLDEITILNGQLNQQRTLNAEIARLRETQVNLQTAARIMTLVCDSAAELLPLSVGVAFDATSLVRGTIKLAGAAGAEYLSEQSDDYGLQELAAQNALQEMQAGTSIQLTSLRNEFAVQERLRALEQVVRGEASARLGLFNAKEALNQASGRFLAALARGERLLEERDVFRRQTAADVQARRYKDMAFRIFRNDALQKYRAQFDLAARYVYLAAKAYDYETTLLSGAGEAGANFLADVVRQRLIGTTSGGLPQTGIGLADPMARMAQNFSVIKPQLGFNNPQVETNRFSLRSELFRVLPGAAGNTAWRDVLRRHVVADLNDLDEFRRHARFVGGEHEPAIVIPFSSVVGLGTNFFGWPLGPGDNAYDPSHFATKVRSVGVWFSNYDSLSLANTPRAYLIPVGSDVLRSPTRPGETRQFSVLDQRLPAPFAVGGADLGNPSWIPIFDTLAGFADIRLYSSFRAYHDSGAFVPGQVERSDSRAIGRSVWNTRWLLVIPAGTLLADREEGIERFIDGRTVGGRRDGNGVSDIKIFFETYAYSGN